MGLRQRSSTGVDREEPDVFKAPRGSQLTNLMNQMRKRKKKKAGGEEAGCRDKAQTFQSSADHSEEFVFYSNVLESH